MSTPKGHKSYILSSPHSQRDYLWLMEVWDCKKKFIIQVYLNLSESTIKPQMNLRLDHI